jgi:hypothetical protein
MASAGNEDAGDGGEQPDPRATLMQEVAEQMDAIETDFGRDYEIGAIVTIVEVRQPNGAGVRVRCNAPPWVGLGMLKIAERVLESQA